MRQRTSTHVPAERAFGPLDKLRLAPVTDDVKFLCYTYPESLVSANMTGIAEKRLTSVCSNLTYPFSIPLEQFL